MVNELTQAAACISLRIPKENSVKITFDNFRYSAKTKADFLPNSLEVVFEVILKALHMTNGYTGEHGTKTARRDAACVVHEVAGAKGIMQEAGNRKIKETKADGAEFREEGQHPTVDESKRRVEDGEGFQSRDERATTAGPPGSERRTTSLHRLGPAVVSREPKKEVEQWEAEVRRKCQGSASEAKGLRSQYEQTPRLTQKGPKGVALQSRWDPPHPVSSFTNN
ncbi:hypothetical protein B0H19DRAFT_1061640 [Mycena capillaripes]|nr:hypothetical protein B0H19DRAFT_1061640 [Mycena capillaripes]